MTVFSRPAFCVPASCVHLLWSVPRSSKYFTIGADSSPQLGNDYFIVREEVMTLQEPALDEVQPLRILAVESRTLPVSTIGWGEGGVSRKVSLLLHALILETGVSVSSYCKQVRTMYSDQGVLTSVVFQTQLAH